MKHTMSSPDYIAPKLYFDEWSTPRDRRRWQSPELEKKMIARVGGRENIYDCDHEWFKFQKKLVSETKHLNRDRLAKFVS
jgi:hypothetical protein